MGAPEAEAEADAKLGQRAKGLARDSSEQRFSEQGATKRDTTRREADSPSSPMSTISASFRGRPRRKISKVELQRGPNNRHTAPSEDARMPLRSASGEL